jgi:hypothetical protein
MFSFENELHALFLFVKIKKCAQIPRKSLVNKKKSSFFALAENPLINR